MGPLTRLPDWQPRLHAWLRAINGRPIEPGRHDCCLFGAGAIEAQTGVDIAAPWRGRYTTMAGGRRVLRKSGHADHIALIVALLPEIQASAAREGDIALIETAGEAAVVTESPSDTTPDRRLKVGDGGLLQPGTVNGIQIDDANLATVSGSFRTVAATLNLPFSSQPFGILDVRTGHSSGVVHQYWAPNYAGGTSGYFAMYARKLSGSTGTWTDWARFLTSANTTVDSNGFVKAASPILRLFGDGSIEEPVQPTGAEVARVSAGLYQISSTLGLAQEGWQIEVPRDHNGNILCHVATAWAAGVLTVTVSEPLWDNGRWVAGDPVDVPAGRWIDIRLHEEPVEEPEPESEN